MSKGTQKRIIFVFVMTVAFLVSVTSKVYFISDHAAATIFWKENEAYLFLGTGHTGYSFNWLTYPFVRIAGYFHVGTSPTDSRGSLMVIHVLPSTIERQGTGPRSQALVGPEFVVPFEDGFYGVCPGGIVCKWTSSGYRPATDEERRKVGDAKGLDSARGGLASGIVDGWHVRNARLAAGDHFEADLGDGVVVALNSEASASAYPRISVQLLRPDRAPESLYSADGTNRRVSKSEYENTFAKR